MAWENETAHSTPVPTVLVIGCSARFAARCRAPAAQLGAAVHEAELMEYAMTAARLRPLVLLMTDETYAFDPAEFVALARDVGGQLLLLPGEWIAVPELGRRLGASMSEATLRRRLAPLGRAGDASLLRRNERRSR